MVNPIETIIFDMDNTLLEGASFNRFGYTAGVDRAAWDNLKNRYREDPASAEKWGMENAEMLKQVRVATVMEKYGDIPYMPGVKEFFADIPPGVKNTGILTSGIDTIADKVIKELGMDFSASNILTTEAGIITGDYKLVVSMYDKLEKFARLMYEQKLALANTLYVGDNKNDAQIMEFVQDNGGYAAAFNPVKYPALSKIAQFTFEDFRQLTSYVKAINECASEEGVSTDSKIVDVVGVILLNKNKVALVIEAKKGREGMLNIPGGRVEPGETHQGCVKREAKEETGLDIVVTGFIGEYERQGDRGDKLVKRNFSAVIDGTPGQYDLKPSNKREILGVGFFDIDEIIKHNHPNMPSYVRDQLVDSMSRKPAPIDIVGKLLKTS